METTDLMLASDPSTPRDKLAYLATSTNPDIRRACAGNPSTPAYRLEFLARYPDVAIVLLGNPSCPDRIEERLHQHVAKEADILMAEHRTREDWERRANGPWEERAEVAGNEHAPGHILDLLASDPDSDVRARVGLNAVTPDIVLDLLAVDEVEDVRNAVSVNEGVHDLISQHLLKEEPNFTKKQAAKFTLNDWKALAHMDAVDPWDRLHVACSLYAPSNVLAGLAEDEDAYIRSQVAMNARTPLATLGTLTQDPEPGVRLALTRNVLLTDATHAGVLRALELDTHPSVVRGLTVAMKPKRRKRSFLGRLF